MHEDYSTIEQNLRRILRQPASPTEETDKENSESINVPANPFAKRQFNKKLRSSRFNQPLRSESEERILCNTTESRANVPQACLSSGRKSNQAQSAQKCKQRSSAKQKKGLAEYLWDDKVERRVEENNRLFADLIEYVMNLREKVNTQLRQTTTDSSCRSNSKRDMTAVLSDERDHQKSVQLILSNIKLYFEQVLQPQLLGEGPSKYPKRIETVIEFEDNQLKSSSSKNQVKTLPQPRETVNDSEHPTNSSVSYFRKSLVGGAFKTLENSRKNSRADKRSLENTMKSGMETSGMDTQKKSSVYEMILNQRRSRMKKTK